MNKLATLILTCLMGALGHLLIKRGLNDVGQYGVNEIFTRFFSVITNRYILASIFLYAVGVLIYLSLLSRTQLSTLYPMAIGIDFVLIAVASNIYFREALSLPKILGLALILVGISCFSYSRI